MSAIGTLMAWVTWVIVVFRIDPLANPVIAPVLFFVSLFLAMLGTGTIVGFLARHWFEREGVMYRKMTVAARQALNIGAVVVFLLLLQAGRGLSIWTGMLTVIVAVGIEAFFLLGQTRQRADMMYHGQV